jgi:hypothetical protein
MTGALRARLGALWLLVGSILGLLAVARRFVIGVVLVDVGVNMVWSYMVKWGGG